MHVYHYQHFTIFGEIWGWLAVGGIWTHSYDNHVILFLIALMIQDLKLRAVSSPQMSVCPAMSTTIPFLSQITSLTFR